LTKKNPAARLFEAFGAWINRGPFTLRDVAILRIIIAGALLVSPASFAWIDRFPDSLFVPLPGPFQWSAGLPPHGFFSVLDVVLLLATLMMGIGLATRWSSLLVSVLLIVGHGYGYSFGKLDHTIILALLPAILSFSNWGGVFSIDALIRRSRPRPVRLWAVRLFALTLGISFATAAWAKISTGWLSPQTQVIQAYFLRAYFTAPSDHNAISNLAASIQAPWLWEVLDWTVVLIEATLAVAFVSWRLLRVAISLATIFHLGVFIMLGIQFSWNVIAYGAFVSWGRLPGLSRLQRWRRQIFAALVVVLVALTILDLLAEAKVIGRVVPSFDVPILWVGACAGGGYLIWIIVRAILSPHRGRLTSPTPTPTPAIRPGVVATLLIVCLILVALFPIGYAVKTTDTEPYPALFQPDFNGPGPLALARVRATAPSIRITFADGSTKLVTASAVMPAPTAQGAVFKAAFWDQDTADVLQTRTWLRARLASVFAPRIPVAMTVDWKETKYDHISGKVTWVKLVKVVRVRLAGH
jgi:uncharacterized membrane protein YphA (DoxX/SURF4 family)